MLVLSFLGGWFQMFRRTPLGTGFFLPYLGFLWGLFEEQDKYSLTPWQIVFFSDMRRAVLKNRFWHSNASPHWFSVIQPHVCHLRGYINQAEANKFFTTQHKELECVSDPLLPTAETQRWTGMFMTMSLRKERLNLPLQCIIFWSQDCHPGIQTLSVLNSRLQLDQSPTVPNYFY